MDRPNSQAAGPPRGGDSLAWTAARQRQPGIRASREVLDEHKQHHSRHRRRELQPSVVPRGRQRQRGRVRPLPKQRASHHHDGSLRGGRLGVALLQHGKVCGHIRTGRANQRSFTSRGSSVLSVVGHQHGGAARRRCCGYCVEGEYAHASGTSEAGHPGTSDSKPCVCTSDLHGLGTHTQPVVVPWEARSKQLAIGRRWQWDSRNIGRCT
mmetsp:Transcript_36252/g.68257  ORF Transcript_36252/g.68257 Transcript_36252/m.68257 type:complete len:210 (-) Transcript_36252:250-879(-)